VDTARLQRKRAMQKYVEKGFGERNVDSGLRVQLEEGGNGSTRQSWIETTALWHMMHWQ